MRLVIGWFVFVSLLLGASAPVAAEEVVDQSFFGGVGSRANFGGIDYAQTFTVGVEGKLSRVIVEVIQLENVSVQILATENGIPTNDPADILASVPAPTIPQTPSNVLYETDLSEFDIQVQPGDVLTIAIVGELDDIKNWRAAFEDINETYPGGAAYRRVSDQPWEPATTADFNFETYVELPEEPEEPVPATGVPGSVALTALLAGLGALLLRRRLA